MQLDTVPRELTPELLAFCGTISDEAPCFVPSVPGTGAVLGSCFDNVAREVERSGGSIVHGWAIWHLRGAYYEAEHHGIWSTPGGELLDVTPQLNGAPKLLFLPDLCATYDPARFRRNVIEAEAGNAVAAEFVRFARRRSEIVDSYRAGSPQIAKMTIVHKMEVALIMLRMNDLLERLRAGGLETCDLGRVDACARQAS
ncbi:hypothetical protein E2493_09805 [Sphingomonas parva]|uniref:Uncharacterized protein n=1 Tax=Sphingomonas parva TaxID=2555898 RepID=A0A4Y8ZQW7_9SPHN|nr:hypothetical protein [Sphingomonas parva]TFI58420.1 hypothetical protein E2493_09805 [Sphingomonas parva]